MPSTKAPHDSKPPSKHHYVRIHGSDGMRVYATNLALRELAPLLVQDAVSEAIAQAKKKLLTAKFSAGRGKAFTVRVNPDKGETHLQMSTER